MIGGKTGPQTPVNGALRHNPGQNSDVRIQARNQDFHGEGRLSAKRNLYSVKSTFMLLLMHMLCYHELKVINL